MYNFDKIKPNIIKARTHTSILHSEDDNWRRIPRNPSMLPLLVSFYLQSVQNVPTSVSRRLEG